MTPETVDALIDALVPEVKALVEARLVDVRKAYDREIEALRARLADVKDGAPGRDGQDGAPGPAGPEGAVGAPGPQGEPGPPGPQGPAGPKGEIGPAGPAGAQGPRGEKGLDGRDGQSGLPGRDGKDGAPGLDGKDGADGLGFDDLRVEYDGQRTMSLVLERGERVKRFDLRLPIVLDRGVFETGKAYEPGDAVTWAGSLFIAQAPTSAKPGEAGEASRAWRLAVKRGGEGKRGADGPQGPPGPRGEQGPPGRGY